MGNEREWVVRVNSRRVQWSEAVYRRMFGRSNVANGMPYAIIKAETAEEAIKKFCTGAKPNTGYNEFYFEAAPKPLKIRVPAPLV